MMGVLNFAHAGIYMIGAYVAFETSRYIGFWPGTDRRARPLRRRLAPHRDVGAAPHLTTTATSQSCCSPLASSSSSSGACR